MFAVPYTQHFLSNFLFLFFWQQHKATCKCKYNFYVSTVSTLCDTLNTCVLYFDIVILLLSEWKKKHSQNHCIYLAGNRLFSKMIYSFNVWVFLEWLFAICIFHLNEILQRFFIERSTYPKWFGTSLAILISLDSHLFLHFLHEARPVLAFSMWNGLSDSSVSDIA